MVMLCFFSCEEDWDQKGLIFFPHHILGQFHPLMKTMTMTEAMGAVEMVDSDGFFGVDSRLQKNDDLLDRVFSLNGELGFFGFVMKPL
ncbi:hypothetical protein H5410_025021 [Solanum commersonii]|uniref:Uncharacterized protein n=1 Tax=Solanum commersonii TaxID=4109 RepID=A0A9J5YSM7_SOLCO|nr:hypothetical protein H5410_025021 [Solanum commersonii]